MFKILRSEDRIKLVSVTFFLSESVCLYVHNLVCNDVNDGRITTDYVYTVFLSVSVLFQTLPLSHRQ